MTRIILQISLILLSSLLVHASELPHQHAVALSPTPVLNSPEFSEVFGGRDGNSLKTDNCGQIRELEFVALPGTLFNINEEIAGAPGTIYRVTTKDYPVPSSKGLYIDSRFVRIVDTHPLERNRTLPGQDEILKRLRGSEGIRYVWGGNVSVGIPKLPELYPPRNTSNLSPEKSSLWSLAGLDCSGLLYESTGGWTPRNTSDLVQFGKPVAIAGLNASAIAKTIRPLDLIVWPGHILIAIDNGEVVESRLFCDGRRSGVVISSLRERISEILRTRQPLNSMESKGKNSRKGFVVRRWNATDTPSKQ